ncbi:hypothetical protein R84B8_01787 [Treponema sp. R8-4-B8]
MNKKIIITGRYCATGKSVFSRKLSGLLNIPCFNKDIIEETLSNVITDKEKEKYNGNRT